MRSLHPAALAAALAAVALLAGCGQPLLSMQLEVPEIRMTSPGNEFPATGLALPTDYCDLATPGCVFNDLQYDLGAEVPVLEEKGVSFDLRLTDVALHLVSGTSDLRGVLSARVKIQDPVTGDWIVVASYAKPPGATPTDISVSGNSNIELAPYLSSGNIDARIEVSYDASSPPGAFTADVEAGFSLVVTVSYDAYI
jgi:hypothetical protein